MNIIKKITLLGLLLGITIPQATNAFSFGDQPSIRVISQYVMAAINTAKSYLTFNTIKEHPEVNRSVIGFGLPLACATIATKIENPQVRNAAIGIGLATSAYGVGYGYAALTLRSAHNKFD